MMEVDVKGGRHVRYGDALAWVEAQSESDAVRRSLDLHRLGDWTDDARDLVVFTQDAYPEHAGARDYTRAVLNANPAPRRRSSSWFPRQSRLALVCLVGVLALGFVQSTVADTWRGLTVAPEHRCAPYDKVHDCPLSPVGRARHRPRAWSGLRPLDGAMRRIHHRQYEHS